MIAYFIELAIIHLALTLVYIITMRGERQYQLMRYMLLFTIPVAALVPLISFDGFLGTETGSASTELNSIMVHSLTPIVVGTQSVIDRFSVLTWIYLSIAGLFLVYFLVGLISIVKLVSNSRSVTIDGIKMHLIKEKGSFTFSAGSSSMNRSFLTLTTKPYFTMNWHMPGSFIHLTHF